MRSFLAFPLPTDALTYAAVLQRVFREEGVRGKWTRPETQHLTAQFLGDRTEDELTRLGDAIEAMNAPAPVLDCIGPGAFGKPPSVLTVAWDDPTRAYRNLVLSIRDAMRETGIPCDPPEKQKKPVPHVTLLRIRDDRMKRLVRRLRRITPDGPAWPKNLLPPVPNTLQGLTFDSLVLFQSTLTPDGPVYDALRTFPLGQ